MLYYFNNQKNEVGAQLPLNPKQESSFLPHANSSLALERWGILQKKSSNIFLLFTSSSAGSTNQKSPKFKIVHGKIGQKIWSWRGFFWKYTSPLVNAKICLSSTATSTISSPNKLSTIFGFCEDSKEPCPRQPSDPFPE